MPADFRPDDLFKSAMNPGLGVRRLHARGITGKGVNVGIIDQPLFQDHPEFAGKIAAYHDVGCNTEESSMHGPAVASLLVGTQCGTAPGARLYHVAAPSWTGDTAYQAKALDWLVEQSKALPAGQKIRVVSISAAPSGRPPFRLKMWDEPASGPSRRIQCRLTTTAAVGSLLATPINDIVSANRDIRANS
jgi:subtilisin family serine protease